MITIDGFKIKTELHHSQNSIVYRGERTIDNQAVILKLLAHEYPTANQVARFQREYQLGQKLALPELVTLYELLPFEHRWLIVAEDFGGESLQRLQAAGKLDLTESLQIAVKITQALAALHAKRVIHKDINLANIVYNQTTGQLKLIDLGIATELSREEVGFRSPHALEGTLAYISPEQTGRMNRAIDYRTDFYSLGVVLYELLTGQLPFQATDRLALLHAHLAQPPAPLEQLRPDIPAVISQIVLKLMAKEAEHRYQSAWGLLADLRYCLDRLPMLADLQFELGHHDQSNRLVLTDRLFGREAQIAQLETLFRQVQAGSGKLGLISGPAGIGKTVLVKELYRAITGQRGYFIEGKHDQFKRDVPYHGLTQAFDGLVGQILQEDEANYTYWRTNIQSAVGATGQVLVELMPQLELLIGPQPPVPALGPLETQNRLQTLFREFVGCFLGHGYPLVIFLDNLQWADGGSLTLLEQLVTNSQFTGLLVLATYRDNEVKLGLRHFLDDLISHDKTAEMIALQPLPIETTAMWLAEILNHKQTDVLELATLLHQKSGGNPFFVRELLKQLYLSELIYINQQAGQWAWDMPAIHQLALSDNVVVLLSERLQKLPAATQRTLQYAACLGNRFELSLLAIVLEQSIVQVAEQLQAALTAEIIIPLDENYRYVQADSGEQAAYRFAHDRLQQAAYELLSEEKQAQAHWRIGQLLQTQLDDESENDILLEIVHHLNLGAAFIRHETERLALAELNHQAGQRARISGAFEAMAEYINFGLSLIEAPDWQTNYQLILELHLAGAEAAYLTNNFTHMQSLVDTGLQEARSTLDQTQLELIPIMAASIQTHYTEAVQLGWNLLQKLGIVVPLEPTEAEIGQKMEQVFALWQGREIADLANLPAVTDPHQQMILTALMAPAPAAFFVNQPHYLLLICEGLQQGLRHGNTKEMSIVYSVYGILISSIDISAAYAFGKLGVDLIEPYNAYKKEPRVLFVFSYFLAHWCQPLQDCMSILRQSIQVGAERGNFEFAQHSTVSYLLVSYLAGQEMAKIVAEYTQYKEQFSPFMSEWGPLNQNIEQQAIFNLQQEAGNPLLFQGPFVDERILVPHWQSVGKNSELLALNNHKLVLAYLFEAYDAALQLTEFIAQNAHYMISMPWIGVTAFYEALVYLAIYPHASATDQVSYLEKVIKIQANLQHWATYSPTTYQHKYDLVEAERLNIMGQRLEAMPLYDQAAAAAQANGFQHEAALANELAGKFYLQLGHQRIAPVYFYEAIYLYNRWGAVAKVNQLTKQYPFLKSSQQQPISSSQISQTTSQYTTVLSNLDTETVVTAMQAISQQIELAPLLTQLLQVIVENVGAERGLLLLFQQGDWFLEGEIHQGEITVLQHQPLSQIDDDSPSPKLSKAIINAIIRQAKPIVLDNASREGGFVHQPYIQQTQPKSILAVPLLSQNIVTGVLYLENNLTTHAFTPERVELVRLLGTQAAISINNAQAIALKTEQERLQLENELLEKLNANKDKFFSIVAHDLKGPFLPLLGNLELLAEMADSYSPADIKAISASSHRSAKRVFELLESLLSWARMQMGRMDYQPKTLSLQAIAQQTIELLSSVAEEKNINLSQSLPSGLQVYADANMLDTIIRNVTNNALKFTSSGGQVVIEGQSKSNGWVELSIHDNGVGMSETNQQKLFHIDQNVTTTGTANEKGTGLGLMMCQEMVQMHGGRIWVESELGQGTTVRFTVPSTSKLIL